MTHNNKQVQQTTGTQQRPSQAFSKDIQVPSLSDISAQVMLHSGFQQIQPASSAESMVPQLTKSQNVQQQNRLYLLTNSSPRTPRHFNHYEKLLQHTSSAAGLETALHDAMFWSPKSTRSNFDLNRIPESPNKKMLASEINFRNGVSKGRAPDRTSASYIYSNMPNGNHQNLSSVASPQARMATPQNFAAKRATNTPSILSENNSDLQYFAQSLNGGAVTNKIQQIQNEQPQILNKFQKLNKNSKSHKKLQLLQSDGNDSLPARSEQHINSNGSLPVQKNEGRESQSRLENRINNLILVENSVSQSCSGGTQFKTLDEGVLHAKNSVLKKLAEDAQQKRLKAQKQQQEQNGRQSPVTLKNFFSADSNNKQPESLQFDIRAQHQSKRSSAYSRQSSKSPQNDTAPKQVTFQVSSQQLVKRSNKDQQQQQQQSDSAFRATRHSSTDRQQKSLFLNQSKKEESSISSPRNQEPIEPFNFKVQPLLKNKNATKRQREAVGMKSTTSNQVGSYLGIQRNKRVQSDDAQLLVHSKSVMSITVYRPPETAVKKNGGDKVVLDAKNSTSNQKNEKKPLKIQTRTTDNLNTGAPAAQRTEQQLQQQQQQQQPASPLNKCVPLRTNSLTPYRSSTKAGTVSPTIKDGRRNSTQSPVVPRYQLHQEHQKIPPNEDAKKGTLPEKQLMEKTAATRTEKRSSSSLQERAEGVSQLTLQAAATSSNNNSRTQLVMHEAPQNSESAGGGRSQATADNAVKIKQGYMPQPPLREIVRENCKNAFQLQKTHHQAQPVTKTNSNTNAKAKKKAQNARFQKRAGDRDDLFTILKALDESDKKPIFQQIIDSPLKKIMGASTITSQLKLRTTSLREAVAAVVEGAAQDQQLEAITSTDIQLPSEIAAAEANNLNTEENKNSENLGSNIFQESPIQVSLRHFVTEESQDEMKNIESELQKHAKKVLAAVGAPVVDKSKSIHDLNKRKHHLGDSKQNFIQNYFSPAKADNKLTDSSNVAKLLKHYSQQKMSEQRNDYTSTTPLSARTVQQTNNQQRQSQHSEADHLPAKAQIKGLQYNLSKKRSSAAVLAYGKHPFK